MRQSWRKGYLDKDRDPAAGFVYRNDEGLYTSMFLKPHSIQKPVEQGDWEFIGEHRKLAPAKQAVEKWAKKNGYTQTGGWR